MVRILVISFSATAFFPSRISNFVNRSRTGSILGGRVEGKYPRGALSCRTVPSAARIGPVNGEVAGGAGAVREANISRRAEKPEREEDGGEGVLLPDAADVDVDADSGGGASRVTDVEIVRIDMRSAREVDAEAMVVGEGARERM
jgi:hypothetical protein